MKELYDKGYVHRDLKPENIFIDKNIFKVADYGFACKYEKGSKMKFWVFLNKKKGGTPGYMCP